MQAYRLETEITEDGTLQLKAIPFRKGELVEVIVLAREDVVKDAPRSPLRGAVLKYDAPTEPVAEGDWIMENG